MQTYAAKRYEHGKIIINPTIGHQLDKTKAAITTKGNAKCGTNSSTFLYMPGKKNILPQFIQRHGEAGSDEASAFTEIPFELHLVQSFIVPLTPPYGALFMEWSFGVKWRSHPKAQRSKQCPYDGLVRHFFSLKM